ncbi:6-phosphogluconolactonase [Pseudoxanthomonas sp. F37]|uniref:6-phosphogluconolactonase n=1 Tax=Pseudoxanthomonas TaxID=83618 RepID=UPI001FCFE844|nr:MULTISPECIES: 6-phosphogluconolactonase [Pseudoxanthomonas]UOV03919.1 6-phosphogluconolactonase [Pseudoxanthomonas mexicana]UOV08918.1 6-phosphogluconolactonase [Pseudoxanthomonas sp. F37]
MPPTDLSLQIQLHPFPDGDAVAQALAQAVADDLRAALALRGEASVALSGGTTPRRFLQALSRQPMDWANVTVTLVDERWVDERHERSNARLVKEHLLQEAAAGARFVPLYRPAASPDLVLADVTAALPATLDVAVLGMGGDGHTASFFPGGDRLAEAMDPDAPERVLPMLAPGAGEPRITLTLPVLRQAGRLYLHIEGGEKRQVLQQALSGQGAGAGYPIRALLQALRAPLQVYLTQ